MARPHIEPFCDRDVPFKNMVMPGFSRGFTYKVLSLDNESGACSLTVQLEGGYTQPPGFSFSELEIMVVEGSLQVGDRTVNRGHYFFVPAGYALPKLHTEQGALLLMMYNTSEPNHTDSDEHHPLCRTELYHDVDSYASIAWAPGNIVSPSVAAGVMIKLLNYNPISMAMTFLYTMSPQFHQDNISYHDCAEEGYHLWGTSWMMQFGELPTGGYFWRPPYINHGAFASELGCIALGRTDSKLYNHFHYNPWSTLEENHQRSAARLAKRDPNLYKWVVSYGHNHPHGPEDFEDTMQRRGHTHADGTHHDHDHGDHQHHHHDD